MLCGALVAVTMVWYRFISRRRIPCPPWMLWFLESRYTRFFAGCDSLLTRADVREGMHVLDVGCGSGRFTIPVAMCVGPNGSVTALDVQSRMLQIVERRARAANLSNVRLLEGDAGTVALLEAAFDRAFMNMTLGEIPDRLSALKCIFGALKPGGILAVTEMLPDPDYQPKATVRCLASQAGFVQERVCSNRLAFTMILSKPNQ